LLSGLLGRRRLERPDRRRGFPGLSGDIDRAVTVQGIAVTRGVRAAIEAAGGKVED